MKIRILLLAIFSFPALIFSMDLIVMDTCSTNDFCDSAIDLPVSTDLGFYCQTGCTDQATAEWFDNPCGIGYSATVWFRVNTDQFARVMNIHVSSDVIKSMNVSLFKAENGCVQLEPVSLTSNNVPCLQGYNGLAKAVGTRISKNSTYYLAITDVDNTGGTFELCVNTFSFGYKCVQDRNIEITSRLSGGPLEGPFLPGERISICFNVNSYNAADNGCQFFQGLIPVFGNGWDPASFDANGQPINTTINGMPIAIPNNGIYGSATWDWFTDVDYHYDNPYLQEADLDNNGTVDMCSLLCDPWCANIYPVKGSCCAPCWGNPLGTILPPGWLAYGNNGPCPTPGPPIRVDAGDGVNCDTMMGPWKFCFDLVTRDFPDCKTDITTTDLTLAFFTTTDVETGAWAGSPILCHDLPTYLIPGLICTENNNAGTTTLDDVCSGDVVSFELDVPGVDYWEWTVSPSANVNDSVFEGENGHILQSYPDVTGSSPVVIRYDAVGHEYTSSDVVYKRIQYRAWPTIQYQLPHEIEICEFKPGMLQITPTNISGGKPPLHYLWNPTGDTLSSLTLDAPFQESNIQLSVYDTIGCITNDSVEVKLKSCDFDEMYPDPGPNDTIHHQPTLPHDGNYTTPGDSKRIRTNFHEFNSTTDHRIKTIQLYPVPGDNKITLKWLFALQHPAEIEIFNLQGNRVQKIQVNLNDGNRKEIDIHSLPDGIYLVCFNNEEFRYMMRMVKI